MEKYGFVELLKGKGYFVRLKSLPGGYVNDVKLVTATKGELVHEYVLKKYKSEKELKSMLSGYDKLAGLVKTPTITYVDNKSLEVVFDFISGKSIKSLIKDKDNDSQKAVILLAKELQRLHKLTRVQSRYRHDDSPEERTILAHSLHALEYGRLERGDVNAIFRLVKKYMPSFKSKTHGDAHIGNFIYSKGELYFIDSDSSKISDHNSDVGKVVDSIDLLCYEKKISRSQANLLKDLFLEYYSGEDEAGVNVHRLRTPLRQIREPNQRISGQARLSSYLHGLESKMVASVGILAGITILWQNTGMTGHAVARLGANPDPTGVVAALTLALALSYFFYGNKN